MKSTSVNSFSFHRLDQVWSFYEPGVKRYLLWTLLIVVVAFAFAYIGKETKSMNVFSMSMTLMAIPFYLGATAFTFYRDRSLTCQLPATSGEKFTFMLLFCYLILPLCIFLIWMGMEGVAALFGNDELIFSAQKKLANEYLSEINMSFKPIMNYAALNRITSDMFAASIVLYIVIAAKRQRFMMAIGGAIGSMVAVGLISGIYTAVRMISFVKEHDYDVNEEIIAPFLSECIFDIMTWTLYVSPIISVIIIYLSWRKLKSFQI